MRDSDTDEENQYRHLAGMDSAGRGVSQALVDFDASPKDEEQRPVEREPRRRLAPKSHPGNTEEIVGRERCSGNDEHQAPAPESNRF